MVDYRSPWAQDRGACMTSTTFGLGDTFVGGFRAVNVEDSP